MTATATALSRFLNAHRMLILVALLAGIALAATFIAVDGLAAVGGGAPAHPDNLFCTRC